MSIALNPLDWIWSQVDHLAFMTRLHQVMGYVGAVASCHASYELRGAVTWFSGCSPAVDTARRLAISTPPLLAHLPTRVPLVAWHSRHRRCSLTSQPECRSSLGFFDTAAASLLPHCDVACRLAFSTPPLLTHLPSTMSIIGWHSRQSFFLSSYCIQAVKLMTSPG